MKFIYDKKIDQECHQRLAVRDNIFGEIKKTEVYLVTPEIIKKFVDIWTPEVNTIFNSGLASIFGKKLPHDFTCYINSTPYSMDTINGISISVANPKAIIRTICHEANHHLFRRSKYKEQYFPHMVMEDAKEVFTIVNNLYFKDIMEVPDNGWNKFWKDRYAFLSQWIKDHP